MSVLWSLLQAPLCIVVDFVYLSLIHLLRSSFIEVAPLPEVMVMSKCDVTDPLIQERVTRVIGNRGADVVMRCVCVCVSVYVCM